MNMCIVSRRQNWPPEPRVESHAERGSHAKARRRKGCAKLSWNDFFGLGGKGASGRALLEYKQWHTAR
jgi:hypothetical protein